MIAYANMRQLESTAFVFKFGDKIVVETATVQQIGLTDANNVLYAIAKVCSESIQRCADLIELRNGLDLFFVDANFIALDS